MNKLSATKVAEVLSASAVLLRQAGSEITFLRTKVAELQKQVTQNAFEKRASALATAMQDAGLDSALSYEQKVAAITKRAAEIDVLEQAVKMASKASVDGAELLEDGSPSGVGHSKSVLLDYIVTAP
jgi:hypothetical protein